MAGRETLLSLIENLSRASRKTAYIHRTQYRRSRWKFIEILEHAKRFAVLLETRGITKGDTVILWGENSPEWIIAFLGCVFKGVIVVPMDDTSSEEFVLKIQKIVKAKMAVVSAGKSLGDDNSSLIQFEKLEEAIAQVSLRDFAPAFVSPNDTVEIVFTSGTTAEPKGVIVSNRNIMSNLTPIEKYMTKYGKWVLPLLSFRFLSLLPLSHMFGQALGIFIPMMLGRTVVLINSLNPAHIRKVIKEEKVWILITVPRILDPLRDLAIKEYEKKRGRRFQELYKGSERMGLIRRIWMFRKVQKHFGWRLRCIVVGGAALSRDMEEFWSRLGIAVVQGYGLTETAPIISINNPLTGKRGSIGRIIGDQQIKVGEDGEILVRGANVTEGYLSDSGIVSVASEEGWFRTGDLGEIDSEGYIFFKGRKKDVIVTAEGMNIFPEDVEAVLNRMEGVKESVIIGIDRKGRDEVHAVMLLEGSMCDPAEIVRASNEILNPHQKIKSFSVWKTDDFPRTPTLKIKRREVSDSLKRALAGEDAPDTAGAPADSLTEAIREISGRKDVEVREGMDLSSDLGLGSIDKVELLSVLEEKYRVSIDETEFSQCASIGELKKLIKESTHELKQIKLPRWTLFFPVRVARTIAQQLFFFPLTRIFCSMKVEGREGLKGLKRPFILVSNHISFLDAPVVLIALPHALRKRVAPLMMQEFFNDYLRPEGVPFHRRFLIGLAYFISTAFFNGYPFPTEGIFRNSMEYTGEIIGKGYCPLVFPEGERSLTGQISTFRPGIGMMVLNMGVSVLPVRIDGLQKVLPVDTYWPKRGKVSITFGRLMTFENGTRESIAKALESAIKSL